MTEPGDRVRPGVDGDHRPPRRRRLRRQRREDVHHQRDQRRPGGHRGEDRPHRSGTAACRCSSSSAAWPGSPAGATWTSSASTPRTPPSCASPTCACRSRTCSGRRRAAGSSSWSTNLPRERLSIALGAVAAARIGAGVDAGVRQGAQGVRAAHRVVPEHPVRAGRDRHRGRHRPALRRRLRPRAQRGRADRRGRGQGQVVDAPSCRAARSTAACSCTAATAT